MSTTKLTTNGFNIKGNVKHNNRYDYSLVNYENAHTKVKIICVLHGIFEQTPNKHLMGRGCPKCSGNIKSNSIEFIGKAKLIHDNKYDYSLVNYINNSTKVKIICDIHGVFEQEPSNHLMGQDCGKCNGKNKTNEEFINSLLIIHKNKYDYSLVEYNGVLNKIKIICPTHGIFEQISNNHLQGQGCPKCSESKGECEIRQYLEENGISFISQKRFKTCKYKRQLPFDFYLPDYNVCIEFDGIQHYEPVKRFGGEKTFDIIQIKDKIKNDFCETNKIILIRIKYNEIINEILKNKLNINYV